MIRIGILASGRGTNARAILQAIDDRRLTADAVALISNREGVAVLDVANEFDVPAHVVPRDAFPNRDAQHRQTLTILREAAVDLVALAGFTAILTPELVAAYPDRIVNIHPSLLPAFAGTMAPQPQADALRAGVKISGCTVHIVTDDLDAGPIVAQAAVPILPDDTVETLADRILAEEHRIYPESLQWFAQGRVRVTNAVVQIESEARQALWPGRAR